MAINIRLSNGERIRVRNIPGTAAATASLPGDNQHHCQIYFDRRAGEVYAVPHESAGTFCAQRIFGFTQLNDTYKPLSVADLIALIRAYCDADSSVYGLSRAQLLELKQAYLTETSESVSWGELADADALVPDGVVFKHYAGVSFVPDDFACSCSILKTMARS